MTERGKREASALGVGVLDVEEHLCVRDKDDSALLSPGWEQEHMSMRTARRTCRDCSSVISSLARIWLSVMSLRARRTRTRRQLAGSPHESSPAVQDRAKDREDAPVQDFGPALPLVRVLEARVARHEVGEERVQLVLCAQLELERVHERDEVLLHSTMSAWRWRGCRRARRGTHLSRLRDPLGRLCAARAAVLGGVLDRRGYADLETMCGGRTVHLRAWRGVSCGAGGRTRRDEDGPGTPA